MEFLFKYISKEKQTESLSEKLCQRFHLAEYDFIFFFKLFLLLFILVIILVYGVILLILCQN